MMRFAVWLGSFLLIASADAAELKKVELQALSGPSAKLSLPQDAQAELAADAVLTLRGKKLPLEETIKDLSIRRFQKIVDGSRAYFVLEYKQTSPQEKERHAKSMYNVKGRTDLELLDSLGFAAVDLDKGEVLWRERFSNMTCDGTWELLQSPSAFYVRVLDAAYAISKGSGRYSWLVREDAVEGTLNDRYFLNWKVVGTSIVFDYVNRVDFAEHQKAPKHLELDIETGRRIYRATKAPKLAPLPIYVYTHRMVEYRGDRPSPLLPKQFDGLRLERTLFLWNKETLEGVIINPQLALLPQILEVARKQRVGGKKVQWKYVIDLLDAIGKFGTARKAQVLGGYKDEFMDGNEILILPPGELQFSGEKIAAEEVAKQLGAVTLPRPVPEKLALKAAPLFLFRDDHLHDRAALSEQDIPFSLKLKWGPYVIHEKTHDYPYYKLEPAAGASPQ